MQGTMRLRARLMACAATGLALAMAGAGAAMAQDEGAADDEDVERILVTGYRSSLENSVEVKQESSSIIEAVTAEDIGRLPDVSIAEALGRLPGLATQRLDGRSQVLSVRGLGPDFSTALLNGREQVSTSDNRGVEFDQYPSELIYAAIVYKTPFAGLIGQGLAGTVDMRTIRPLDEAERIISGNLRYEWNGNGSLNPDSEDNGWRGSITFVDQFANDTVGIALGLAYQSTPTQSERFNAWGYPETGDGELVIGGAKPFVQSNELERLGMVGIFEFAPTASFSTAVDVYYSDFEERQVLRGIELPLFWSAAQLQPGYTVSDGLVTEGTYANVTGVMRNDLNLRETELFAIGWNTNFDFNENWSLETDVSYSRADRTDELIESYSGTGYATSGVTDTLGFAVNSDGFFNFSPTLNYADPSVFVLTDPQGWGAGSGVVQAGFINAPETEDTLTQLRASLTRDFELGAFSGLEFGVNYAMREKNRMIRQEFLTLGGTLDDGDAVFELAIPEAALLGSNAGMAYLGIPEQVTYDPLYLLNNVYTRVPVSLSSFNVPQDWTVNEDVLTLYARLEIDAMLGDVPVSGNVGVQYVMTDQESAGFRVSAGAPGSGDTEAGLLPVVDGDDYSHVLPSMNLTFDLSENWLLRLAAARTLARPRMDQLNAGLELQTNATLLTSTDPDNAYFGASGGNPRLRPYIADGIDVSLERYFGGAGYFAVAAFYRDLSDFVNPNDAFRADFSAYVDSVLSPDQIPLLGTTLGNISGPTNRGEGHLQGFEATLSLPGHLVSPWLDGFGVIASGAYTDSEVLLGDSTDPISVPGLSEWVANTTVYYERGGFEARLSHRYRSSFLAEVSGISATRTLRDAEAESILDGQVSYQLQTGPLEGLTLLFQANNITDEPFITYQNGDERQVIDYQSYGPTYLLGVSHRF